ncbi:MAG: bifunctional histidinol-phosphatase/imidazoleglycerol-phosphate dehydratase HisB [Bacteroidota bacterium]
MKKRILFLDRDGTLIHEPPEDFQVDALDKLAFLPAVITSLHHITQKLDYLLVMVTNQDGLGTDSFPEADFWPPQNAMMKVFEQEDIHFHKVHIDRTFKAEGAPTRKPGTALLTEYMQGDYDLEGSFVVGDRHSDILLAKNLGAKGILLGESTDDQDQINNLKEFEGTLAFETTSWKEIVSFLLDQEGRKAHIQRTTKETDIQVRLDLDGSGTYQNDTGIGFLDHMLDQLARHGNLDLSVQVKGDLHIDEHHSIEDAAIALGQAFSQALGDKRGITRYGSFLLPMDEALAQVALDFSGRGYLVFQAPLKREKVGAFPIEMVEHFFQSFAEHARCTLNIQASGKNDHHIIEAIFKGVAQCIKQAKHKMEGNTGLPSTKGLL